jgi:hypothetical protein
MAGNRVVARFRDGRTVKGTTTDFLPTRAFFHVQEDAGPVSTVQHFELKAIFFVRDLVGDKHRRDTNEFEPGKHVTGRKIRVVFEDGEVLVGTTQGYTPGRPGFFVVPADGGANTERCFVISAATREVTLL